MNSERVFEMEVELLDECEAYIFSNPETKDETMEACVKAFEAVQAYRKALENKEVRRVGTHTDK